MLKHVKKYTVILLMLLLVLYFSLTAKGFATASNVISLLRQVAILGIVSVGMTMVIITGNIDLSVGSQVSLITCVVAMLIVNKGMAPLPACLIGVLVGVIASRSTASLFW